ncbi:hypothetical protein PUR23_15355 [Methylorubrum populi]|uniref:hypothetical protein n=1 Tax=Methylorubrum populi TaxID=223967 RepID=UPI0031F84784
MDWLTFLKDVIVTQQFLQIFVGGCTMMLIGWMVTRARGDRDHLPPPTPVGIADVPAPFLQGPREAVDLMRELRDLARRQAEDISRIAECVRIVRDETRRQTEILGLIEREQAIENRSHERDRPWRRASSPSLWPACSRAGSRPRTLAPTCSSGRARASALWSRRREIDRTRDPRSPSGRS